MTLDRTINLVIVLAVMLVALYLVLVRVDKYLTIKGVDDCGKMTKYEKSMAWDSSKLSQPLLDIYKQCLKDKKIN